MASEAHPPLSRVRYPLTAFTHFSSSDSFVGDKLPPFLVFHSFEHNQLTHTLQEQGHADAPGSVPNRLIDESMVACFLLPKPPCEGLALRRRRVCQDLRLCDLMVDQFFRLSEVGQPDPRHSDSPRMKCPRVCRDLSESRCDLTPGGRETVSQVTRRFDFWIIVEPSPVAFQDLVPCCAMFRDDSIPYYQLQSFLTF